MKTVREALDFLLIRAGQGTKEECEEASEAYGIILAALNGDTLEGLLEKLIDQYPLGHISMRRMTDGRILVTTHDGIGGGVGKVSHYNGDSATEAITKALEEERKEG